MALIRQTSPHTLGHASTPSLMRLVLIALLPALAVQTWFFGWGVLINLVWCSLVALATEAAVLTLRKRPPAFYLKDGSALVTAWLLAMAIPQAAPWWLSLVGVSFAIIFGKQIYGGMGYNPFNPAMLGYVLLLVSFPLEMTQWMTPAPLSSAVPGLTDTFAGIFGGASIDSWTMATPLDLVRENKALTMPELWAQKPQLSGVGGVGWLWVNLAFLAGGLFLLKKKIISWHAPAGMLAGLGIMAFLFWSAGSSSNGSPLFHWLTGATMMGAFFIVTDPVSGATSNRGRLIFGLGVGVIAYVIRAWGGYPDGVAFATLLMNMAAPTIDYWTQPRTYGHRKPNRGMAKSE